MGKTFEYSLKILERHLDTFGHVNNATYLQIYEEARWDFIEANGFGLSKIVELQKGPVILDLHLSFKKELKNRDTINIRSQFCAMKNKLVMEMQQSMQREDGALASQLTLSIGFMDLQQRKLIPPTAQWLSAVGAP